MRRAGRTAGAHAAGRGWDEWADAIDAGPGRDGEHWKEFWAEWLAAVEEAGS